MENQHPLTNTKDADMERVHRMIIAALHTDNIQHKQYYLVEIADELDIAAKEWPEIEKGIAP